MNERDVLISIIIPVYNVEQYLPRCLESIINQSYEKLEIILIDDGSTDNSSQICDCYSKKDKRIVVFHKTNGGLSDARNLGIDKANGEYLSFIDSDDYISENFIETLYYLAEKTHLPISAIGFKIVNDEYSDYINENINYEIIDSPKSIELLFTNEKYGNYAWNKLYKKDLFDNVRYPVGRNMEDLGTTYILFLQCSSIVYSTSKMYFYFQRPGSILHNVNTKHFEDRITLSYKRFCDLKLMYPNMLINDIFITNVLLESYVELQDYKDIEIISNNIMCMISKKTFSGLSITRKLKFILFIINRKLYLKVVKKKC